MKAQATTSRGSSSKLNDVQGAALAIAVLNFMRPRLRKDDLKYDRIVDKILTDYCFLFRMPEEAAYRMEDAIFSEALRLKGALLSSGALVRALARRRAMAE